MVDMTLFQVALFIVLIYICIFGIVNRICKCVEHCATSKSYGQIAVANPEFVDKIMDGDAANNKK